MKSHRWIGPVMLAPVVAAALPGASCSSYKDPSLRVTGVDVRERSADAVVVEFTVEAENPNEEPLPLKEFLYSVSVDGKHVFDGFRSPEATLRRFGTQHLKIPAVIPAAAARDGTVWCRMNATLAYTTPGDLAKVLFDADVRRPEVGFVDERSVDLGSR